jgi:hypothetical protein
MRALLARDGAWAVTAARSYHVRVDRAMQDMLRALLASRASAVVTKSGSTKSAGAKSAGTKSAGVKRENARATKMSAPKKSGRKLGRKR